MGENLILLFAVFWLLSAFISFLNGLARRLHLGQWVVISLLLGPLAFLVSLFLTGRGYRTSIFSKQSADESARPRPPLRIPSDEELLAGKVAFKAEVLELKKSGNLDEAEGMLEVLMDVVEEKARQLDRGVPHWYYEQMANIHRKRGKPKAERRVLERWTAQRHTPNPGAEKRLAERLTKLKEGS